MRNTAAVAAVAGVLLLTPLACGTPSAPSRTTYRTPVPTPAVADATVYGRPFGVCREHREVVVP